MNDDIKPTVRGIHGVPHTLTTSDQIVGWCRRHRHLPEKGDPHPARPGLVVHDVAAERPKAGGKVTATITYALLTRKNAKASTISRVEFKPTGIKLQPMPEPPAPDGEKDGGAKAE